MRWLLLLLLLAPSTSALTYNHNPWEYPLQILDPGQTREMEFGITATCFGPGAEAWDEPIEISWSMTEQPEWLTIPHIEHWEIPAGACARGQNYYHKGIWEMTVSPDARATDVLDQRLFMFENEEPHQSIRVPLQVRFVHNLALFFAGLDYVDFSGDEQRILGINGVANDDLEVVVELAEVGGPYGFERQQVAYPMGQNFTEIPMQFLAHGTDPGYAVIRAAVLRDGLEELRIERNYTLQATESVRLVDLVGGEPIEAEPVPWWPWLLMIVGLLVIAVAIVGRRLSTEPESDES